MCLGLVEWSIAETTGNLRSVLVGGKHLEFWRFVDQKDEWKT